MTEKKEKKKDNSSVVVKLKHPVDWGDEVIKELTLRRPLAGDIEDMGSDPKMKDFMKIAHKISRQPPAFIKKLAAIDMVSITEVIGDFLGSGPETGEIV